MGWRLYNEVEERGHLLGENPGWRLCRGLSVEICTGELWRNWPRILHPAPLHSYQGLISSSVHGTTRIDRTEVGGLAAG